MPDDAVPADLPDQPTETLDDPTEDTLRTSHGVADLILTTPVGEGFDVPTEPLDPDRPVTDTDPL